MLKFSVENIWICIYIVKEEYWLFVKARSYCWIIINKHWVFQLTITWKLNISLSNNSAGIIFFAKIPWKPWLTFTERENDQIWSNRIKYLDFQYLCQTFVELSVVLHTFEMTTGIVDLYATMIIIKYEAMRHLIE